MYDLDLSLNTALTSLSCMNDSLSYLNIRNGNNITSPFIDLI